MHILVMTNEETIVKYLSEMATNESQSIQTLTIQETDSELIRFPTVLAFIRRIKTTSEIHLYGLEALGRSIDCGQSRSQFNKAFIAATGAAMGALGRFRGQNVSKMLKDDYTSLSSAAINYTMLHTAGLALNSPETAKLAQSYLKDIAMLIVELSHVSIPVVIEELSETNSIASDVELQAQKNLHAVWQE